MSRIRFDKLLDYWTPQMRDAFFEAIQNIRDLSQVEQLVKAIEADDIEAAYRAVDLNPVNFRPFDKTLLSVYEAGGNATASVFPALGVGEVGGLRQIFQFNIRNPEAERWISDYSSTLIKEITDDQEAMIRQFLTRALEAGDNPRTTALDLVGRIGASGEREGGLIGLTSSQEEWVSNYAEALASDNPEDALTYALRDRRFDPTVLSASETGEPLAAEDIENMVGAYTNRALRYRGEAIAKTETLTSLHAAQQQAMKQAVDEGIIQEDSVTFIWRTARDDRVRDSHVAMDGQVQEMGDFFISGDGNLLQYPGDPSAPPEDVINCRCWLEPKVDFLAGVK